MSTRQDEQRAQLQQTLRDSDKRRYARAKSNLAAIEKSWLEGDSSVTRQQLTSAKRACTEAEKLWKRWTR